jgi:hypothetical protein
VSSLTPVEMTVIAFERQWWKHLGAKEQAVHDQLALSATRYYQIRNRVMDNPAAFEFDPQLISRLRRIREQGRRARQAS